MILNNGKDFIITGLLTLLPIGFEMATDKHRRSSVFNHEQTLMFGQYREDLATFALAQAEKINNLKRIRETEDPAPGGRSTCNRCLNATREFFKCTGDMFFFSVLAIIMATVSFVMDIAIHACFDCKISPVRLEVSMKP